MRKSINDLLYGNNVERDMGMASLLSFPVLIILVIISILSGGSGMVILSCVLGFIIFMLLMALKIMSSSTDCVIDEFINKTKARLNHKDLQIDEARNIARQYYRENIQLKSDIAAKDEQLSIIVDSFEVLDTAYTIMMNSKIVKDDKKDNGFVIDYGYAGEAGITVKI